MIIRHIIIQNSWIFKLNRYYKNIFRTNFIWTLNFDKLHFIFFRCTKIIRCIKLKAWSKTRKLTDVSISVDTSMLIDLIQ